VRFEVSSGSFGLNDGKAEAGLLASRGSVRARLARLDKTTWPYEATGQGLDEIMVHG
jgi:hypothetical protein